MNEEFREERRRIIIALVIFGIIFASELILKHTGRMPEALENHWIMMIPYLIPYFIMGLRVLKEAVLGIVHGEVFDECFLMTLATVGAFIIGENAEACAVMLFYRVGELFEDYAVGKSRRSIKSLVEIAPEFANRENFDKSIERINPDEVEVGDVLIVKPGEKIPVDGVVIEGSSMLDTAALTGESVPRSAKTGDTVISGCINGEGLLKIRAEKRYENSTVSKILDLVENASSKKSKTENFISRFARVYTPIVVIGALALAIIPSIITRDPGTWILRACTFLVISCPCALVISVPLAFFGGVGAASDIGVLVKGTNYLELMQKLEVLVSDKTGTLTKGEFKVNRIECADGVSEEEILRIAAYAESMSTHPIAKSIITAYGKDFEPGIVKDIENVSGKGIIATVFGEKIYVGNSELLTDNGIKAKETDDSTATVVHIAKANKYLGTILISDTVRSEAKDAVAEIKSNGVKEIVMLTGDRKQTADAVGRELGIDKVYSELLPGDKVDKVEELIREIHDEASDNKAARRLAFIGDGINDAPVLSRADVGIAMGSMGSDAAIEAADIVVMDDDLGKISKLIKIAKKTMGIAMQNIVFSLVVKIAILILGAFGLANMWAAVFADVGVAVICILNSMRMLVKKNK